MEIGRASTIDLSSLASLVLFGGVMYALSGYFKAVILALKLPGPPAVPLFGNVLMAKERDILTKHMRTGYDLFGPLARFWVYLIPFFAVLDPHDLQIILSSKKHTNKLFFYRFMHKFLGSGLITNSVEEWSAHRKLLQPTFHMSILTKYISSFVGATEASFSMLDSNQPKINIIGFVNTCVTSILHETILGDRVSLKEIEDSPFRQFRFVVGLRVARPWFLFDAFYRMSKTASDEVNQNNKSYQYIRKMVQIRRDLRKTDLTFQNKCLLDYMIEISESSPDFSADDVVNEARTFMVGGQETVATAVAFCLFTLTQHADIQQKCYNELVDIFGADTRAPNLNDLRAMKYLEMCIKETLRLYPSIPAFGRKTGEDIQIGKHTLPAGCNVFISPYCTHRLPHIYPDPDKFDPERFTTENCKKRHPYAYLPFSAGPRNCIGYKFAMLEMKTIISKVLRCYKLLPVPGKTDFQLTFRVVLRGSGGLWIRLKPREGMQQSH